MHVLRTELTALGEVSPLSPSAKANKLSIKEMAKRVYDHLNTDSDGYLTLKEFQAYITSIDDLLFVNVSREKAFVIEDFVLEQINLNRDGFISLYELALFLFPPSKSREIGITIKFLRKSIFKALELEKTHSLVQIMDKIVAYSKEIMGGSGLIVRSSGLLSRIDLKSMKTFLHTVPVKELVGNHVTFEEADAITMTIDANNSGCISAIEMRDWLYLDEGLEEKQHALERMKFEEELFKSSQGGTSPRTRNLRVERLLRKTGPIGKKKSSPWGAKKECVEQGKDSSELTYVFAVFYIHILQNMVANSSFYCLHDCAPGIQLQP